MAAKPPGGGGPIPPRAPAAPRAPVGHAPRAPVPIAPPTPRIPLADDSRPRPPSTPDDWESTDVTRPHDMMLSREDVRTIAEQATSAPLYALRAGQDEARARLARIEERLALLERSALTPVAPAVRSPQPAAVAASPPPLPVAPVHVPVPVPVPVAVAAPVPAAASAPAPVAAVAERTSDPFGAVVQQPAARRPEPISMDLSPDEILFDGAKRKRRITVAVLLLLLIAVGTFVGIAMTSQMRSGH